MQKLNPKETTRLKALFGFNPLEGKIIYAEHEIEAYLHRNSHLPFK